MPREAHHLASVKQWRISLQKAIDAKDIREAATNCESIGDILRSQGKFEEALKYHKLEILLCTKLGEPLEVAKGYRFAGLCYLGQSRYQKAISAFRQDIERNEMHRRGKSGKGDPFELQRAFCALGNAYLQLAEHLEEKGSIRAENNVEKALNYFQKSLNEAERLREDPELSKNALPLLRDAYLNVGNVHDFREEFDKAVKCYMRGIGESQWNSLAQSTFQSALGAVYLRAKQFELASDVILSAISTKKAKKCDDPAIKADIGAAYFNLAQVRAGQTNFKAALKALKHAERYGYNCNYAELKDNYNKQAAQKSQLDELQHQLKHAGDNEHEAILTQIADIYQELSMFEEEAKSVIELAGIREEKVEGGANARKEIAEMYGRIGEALTKAKRGGSAVLWHKKEIKIYRELKLQECEATATNNLANALDEAKKPLEEVIKTYERALELDPELRRSVLNNMFLTLCSQETSLTKSQEEKKESIYREALALEKQSAAESQESESDSDSDYGVDGICTDEAIRRLLLLLRLKPTANDRHSPSQKRSSNRSVKDSQISVPRAPSGGSATTPISTDQLAKLEDVAMSSSDEERSAPPRRQNGSSRKRSRPNRESANSNRMEVVRNFSSSRFQDRMRGVLDDDESEAEESLSENSEAGEAAPLSLVDISDCLSALREAEANRNLASEGLWCLQVSRKLLQEGTPNEAVHYGLRALQIAQQLNDVELQMDGHHVLGDCYCFIQVVKAEGEYTKWLRLAEKKNDHGEIWNAHLRLASILIDKARGKLVFQTEAKRFLAAAQNHIEISLRAAEKVKKKEGPSMLQQSLVTKGLCLHYLSGRGPGSSKRALCPLQKALSTAKLGKLHTSYVRTCLAIADVCIECGGETELAEAEKILKKSSEYCEHHSGDHPGDPYYLVIEKALGCEKRASLNIIYQQYNMALQLLTEAKYLLAGIEEMAIQTKVSNIEDTIARCNEAIENQEEMDKLEARAALSDRLSSQKLKSLLKCMVKLGSKDPVSSEVKKTSDRLLPLLSHDKERAELFYQLGEWNSKTKHFEQAARWFRKAKDVYHHLQETQWEMKCLAQACRQYRFVFSKEKSRSLESFCEGALRQFEQANIVEMQYEVLFALEHLYLLSRNLVKLNQCVEKIRRLRSFHEHLHSSSSETKSKLGTSSTPKHIVELMQRQVDLEREHDRRRWWKQKHRQRSKPGSIKRYRKTSQKSTRKGPLEERNSTFSARSTSSGAFSSKFPNPRSASSSNIPKSTSGRSPSSNTSSSRHSSRRPYIDMKKNVRGIVGAVRGTPTSRKGPNAIPRTPSTPSQKITRQATIETLMDVTNTLRSKDYNGKGPSPKVRPRRSVIMDSQEDSDDGLVNEMMIQANPEISDKSESNQLGTHNIRTDAKNALTKEQANKRILQKAANGDLTLAECYSILSAVEGLKKSKLVADTLSSNVPWPSEVRVRNLAVGYNELAGLFHSLSLAESQSEIVSLEFSCTRFGDLCACALADLCKSNLPSGSCGLSSLSELNLEGTLVSDPGWKALLPALSDLGNLHHVNIGYTDFSDSVIPEFSDFLKKTQSLATLLMTGCLVEDFGNDLKFPLSLETLNVSETKLSLRGMKNLVKAVGASYVREVNAADIECMFPHAGHVEQQAILCELSNALCQGNVFRLTIDSWDPWLLAISLDAKNSLTKLEVIELRTASFPVDAEFVLRRLFSTLSKFENLRTVDLSGSAIEWQNVNMTTMERQSFQILR